MHTPCFEAWPDKEEFLALYSDAKEKGRALATPERIEQLRRSQAEEREARARRDGEHNDHHARLMVVVREHGAACPHCGSHSASYRELNGTARLRLACRACGRTCNADELKFDGSVE